MPGCGRPHRGNGLCAMHNSRRRTHGDPLVANLPVWLICTVCDHPELEEIESRIDEDGESARFVAGQFGLGDECVRNHMRKHRTAEWSSKRAAYWVGRLTELREGGLAS